MKIIITGLALFFTQHLFASGVMVRPPAIDRCILFPDIRECKALKAEENKELEMMGEGVTVEPLPQNKIKRRRRRMINPCKLDPDSENCENWKKRIKRRPVNPCELNPDSENCENWKKRIKGRRPLDGAQLSYPCRENPKGPRCLWANAYPIDEVN